MTKEQLGDSFNMPKTATQEDPTIGQSKKRFGTYSATGDKKQFQLIGSSLLKEKMPVINILPKKLNKFKAWLQKINNFITHLSLWRWAAVNHEDFCFFEISFTKIIRFIPRYCPYSADFFVLEIRISKPQIYCFEPFTSIYDYCKINNLDFDNFDNK
ncbi:MAG: hypothetical protein AAF915_18085 [Cyanobacteria bacterium P01_D01_bin.50]